MQHDTTTCNMIQQHTTRWSNGTNFFFTTNVACCCMKSWDRLTGALERSVDIRDDNLFWKKRPVQEIYLICNSLPGLCKGTCLQMYYVVLLLLVSASH